MAISRIGKAGVFSVCMWAAGSACAQAEVDWSSPLGVELGTTSCRQVQRQKRQTWDLWTKYVSEITGGMAFYPEKAVVDDLPGLRRLVIVCDQEQGKVAAVYLVLPRKMMKDAATGFTSRFATVQSHLSDPLQGDALWRDETDYVTINYDERRGDTFDLAFMTEDFHRRVAEYAGKNPRSPAWYEPPY